MNPISNEQFNNDYHKFVLQDPNVWVRTQHIEVKPFNLNPPEKSKKAKKDVKKQKKEDEKENSKKDKENSKDQDEKQKSK